MGQRTDPTSLEYYEGLVRKTAGMYSNIVQEEYEDLCQILRLKCWRALESFDPAKAKQSVQHYVFSCLRNQVKDLLKRKRRDDLYIEDIAPPSASRGGQDMARDFFEAQYLMEDEDKALSGVLADTPLIPSTLTLTERKVVVCLYLEYRQRDIAEKLDITPNEVARAVRAIKDKMADWKPSSNGSAPGVPSRGGINVEST